MDGRMTQRAHGALYAEVRRADGRVERYGLIAYSHPNRMIEGIVRAYIAVKRRLRGF
jgi:hypothetical protein